jgi:hypothetical protein
MPCKKHGSFVRVRPFSLLRAAAIGLKRAGEFRFIRAGIIWADDGKTIAVPAKFLFIECVAN